MDKQLSIQPGPDAKPDHLEGKLQGVLRNAKAENTRRAYRSDFSHFKRWCDSRGASPLPAAPKTVSLYLSDIMPDYAVSTLRRRLAAISTIHKLAGHESPAQSELVRQTFKGIRRTKQQPKTQKEPLLTKHLNLICKELSGELKELRDKAILLVGFAGALRRSEIVGLHREDVAFRDEGLEITIRSSKTDQEGKGHTKGIAFGSSQRTCPVLSLNRWLTKAGLQRGPIFRSVDRHGNLGESALSSRSVANIVKRCVERIGLDPSKYSGHSLRAGTVTQAALNDVGILSIMDQTGHKSERIVKQYYRNATIFKNNASAELGL